MIPPKDCDILYINDSKKLSAAKREALYDEIMEKAVAVGVGLVGPQRIDEINILQATYEAMRGGYKEFRRSTRYIIKRCSNDTGGFHTTGADHQRRCEEYFNWSGKHYCKSDEGPADGRI